MAKSRLRVAVAGLGRIGWDFHAQSLAAHPEYELVAVADTEAERRAEAEGALGVVAVADYGDMLDRVRLDVVVVATPTHLHRNMVLAALDRGLHVMLEKPMAANLRDARAIVRAAGKAGTRLTVYQPHRAAAYFQHLKQIVDSGRIGRVHWVRRGLFKYARRNDWQALRRFGGGMLNNYAAHALDQLLYLVGYDVRRVFGDLQRAASMGDAEDVVKIVLETRGGSIAEVDINQASCISPYEMLVWGTCGGIVYSGDRLWIRSFDPDQLPEKAMDNSLASADREYPSDQIDFVEETVPVDESLEVDVYANLANAILDDAPLLVDPRETLAVMGVMEKARESSGGIRNLRGPVRRHGDAPGAPARA